MFSSRSPNYQTLKTNLRLSINRLKLLEKKKTELALKARKEIADYLSIAKCDRARIRVEMIIREDYLVEAMEMVEMFCDLLLARIALIQSMKELDEGMEESISSLIWAAPRLQTEVQELKVIANQLTLKYGKEYAMMCQNNGFETVNSRLIVKLSPAPPPKILVERYLIEIAKNYNVPFEPDPDVMRAEEPKPIDNLIDIGIDSQNSNQNTHFPPGGGASYGGGGAGGGAGYYGGGGGGSFVGGGAVGSNTSPSVGNRDDFLPPKPGLIPPDAIPPYRAPDDDPAPPYAPPNYSDTFYPPPQQGGLPVLPSPPGMSGSVPTGSQSSPGMHSPVHPKSQGSPGMSNPVHPTSQGSPGMSNPVHPTSQGSPGMSSKAAPPPIPSHPPNAGSNTGIPNIVPPAQYLPPPASNSEPSPGGIPDLPSVPNHIDFPSIPSDSVQSKGGEDVDFDDLTRRFEELKKRK